MFSRMKICDYTGTYSDNLEKLKNILDGADAVVIGAGAGLSTSAGFEYSGERFEKYFSDFREKYGFTDMYSGGFYPYKSLEEFWAFWSRNIFANRYQDPPKDTYKKLFELVKDKDYFVLTTNVDHCFQKSGFDKERLFYTQGDYGLWQCSEPCHAKTYDNEQQVRLMVEAQQNMRVPTALVPRCPVCGKPMSMNLRCDDTFVEDRGWQEAQRRYHEFVDGHRHKKVVYLELGVGGNTPVIIKYPFWQYVDDNSKATYVCINFGQVFCPEDIEDRAILIDSDIDKALNDLMKK